MQPDRLITVAIHTYDKAHELKNILEHEGVDVVLQNVNLTSPSVSAGIRVRIKESDLPLALRVIENVEIFSSSLQGIDSDKQPEIIVPIDFSRSSILACRVAFHIAAIHRARIKMIHAYSGALSPIGASLQLTDAMTFDNIPEVEEEIESEKAALDFFRSKMKKLEIDFRSMIKDGVIPPVAFSSEIIEGIPEEIICETCRQQTPLLVVMGTRGAAKENRALLGSVTAEVLDTCRTDIMTIPESLRFSKPDDINEVSYFALSTQQDILALDALYRLLPHHSISITLLSLPTKKNPDGVSESLGRLLEYCKKNYPAYRFKTASLSLSHEVEDFDGLDKKFNIDLIVVPTPKKNIFARLFNPTLAHKLLFHTDIPLLSIPV